MNGGCEQICVNTEGSHHCDCLTGFVLSNDKTTCEGILSVYMYNIYILLVNKIREHFVKKNLYVDIDECSDNTAGCEQTCINTPGSFSCECDVGYSLLPNGRSCEGMYIYMYIIHTRFCMCNTAHPFSFITTMHNLHINPPMKMPL